MKKSCSSFAGRKFLLVYAAWVTASTSPGLRASRKSWTYSYSIQILWKDSMINLPQEVHDSVVCIANAYLYVYG